MPIVSTKTMFVPIEKGDKEERKIKIHFNQKLGGFYIKIENIWVAYLTEEERREHKVYLEKEYGFDDFMMKSDDFDTLINSFEYFLKKATERLREIKREKVLIVKFAVDSIKEIHHKDGSYEREISSNKRHTWDRMEQTQMTFDYTVGYKCGEVLFNEEMRSLSGYSYRDAFIIGWTKERQAFFSQIHNGFHEMIWKIDEFLKKITEDPKKLDENIRNKIKLLPPVGG